METVTKNQEEMMNVKNYSYLKPDESLVSLFANYPSFFFYLMINYKQNY